MKKWRGLMIPAIVAGTMVFIMSIYSAEENDIKKGSEGGIAFLSGGVGQPEREILKVMGKDYSLKLIFSNQEGEYLSKVTVTVFDHKDERIFFTISNGPYLFIDLPAGVFRLEASFRRDRKTVPRIEVEKGIQRVSLIQW